MGWTGYLILSLEKCSHWREVFYLKNLFGFIFNAQELIEQGALLAVKNIIADYDRIIDEAIKRVVSTLPPAPEFPDEFLDMMMKHCKRGDPLFWREYFKQRSRSPLPDLMRALEKGDIESPGCLDVIEEVQQDIRIVNTQKLLKGNAALEYLNSACGDENSQILVWEHLSVDQAIGTVQQGKPCINENCQNLNSLEELEDEKSILYH